MEVKKQAKVKAEVKKRTSAFTSLPMPVPVCFITGGDNVAARVQTMLEAGIKWVQYRPKSISKKEMFYEALELREITNKYNARLTVNDYADLAIAVDADGLHLGQEDLPLWEAKKIAGNRIIGISTHNVSEAKEAEKGGADYIGFGPIFHTTTKDAGRPKGLEALREIKDAVRIPVLAIGGIRAVNVNSVFETGCYGAAVSSGLMESDKIEDIKTFLDNIRRVMQ